MRVYGITDVGCARTVNQDCCVTRLFDEGKQGILLVCDGMGGTHGGEVASDLASKKIVEILEQGIKPKMTKEYMSELLKIAFGKANEVIENEGKKDRTLAYMGTTAVCALIDGENGVVANVGDSRCYIVANGTMKQITCDHSLVNDLVANGKILPEEAQNHPNKNIITRVLGGDNKVICDTFTISPVTGTYILLCSDGLTNEISDPEICFEIVNNTSLEASAKELIAIAKKRGGHDNITVLLGAF